MRRFGAKYGLISALASIVLVACTRTAPAPPLRSNPGVTSDSTSLDAGLAAEANAVNEVVDAAPATRAFGPYELPLLGKRKVYYAVSKSATGTHRLLANLHGMCNPPGYACG